MSGVKTRPTGGAGARGAGEGRWGCWLKLDVTAVGQGRAWAGLAPTGGETELGRDVGGTVKINAEGQGGRGQASPLRGGRTWAAMAVGQ